MSVTFLYQSNIIDSATRFDYKSRGFENSRVRFYSLATLSALGTSKYIFKNHETVQKDI